MSRGDRNIFFNGASKQCAHCKNIMPLEMFSPQKNGKGGRTSKCRECKRIVNQASARKTGRYKGRQEAIGFDNTSKICTDCGNRKPLELFSSRPRGTGGRDSKCKPCREKITRAYLIKTGAHKGFGGNSQRQREMASVADNSKICILCRCRKPLSEYFSAKRGIAGRDSQCKACRMQTRTERGQAGWDYSKHHARMLTLQGRASSLLSSIRFRCRKNNIPFDLDRAWMIKHLAAGKCAATGLRFELENPDSNRTHRLKNAFSPSVDRVDPRGGYTKENCRLVIANYNFGKSNWTDDVVFRVALAVIANPKFGAD
jgi:hypothetical protein